MADGDVSPSTLALINQHLPTMDHVQTLLHLRTTPDGSYAHDLAAVLGLDAAKVSRALDDLVSAGLAAREPGTGLYRWIPHADAAAGAVAGLELLYRTRPVTLVRLIYDRPPAALRSFADAFRLRGPATDQ